MKIVLGFRHFFPIIAALPLLLSSNLLSASELYFIDAHSQVDHEVGNLELIIQLMDQAGVYRTILAARSGRKPREIANFANKHPDRIIPAVRTKSEAYNRNSKKYYKTLHNEVDSGRFSAMAEVLLYHAKKGHVAPEVIVYPSDARVQAALAAAIEKGWPFVVHIEFASLGRRMRKRFMEALEEMLDAHPDHPFALIHKGQLSSADVHRLIEKHQNIHFLTAHTNPIAVSASAQPWVNLFRGDTLAPEWKKLIMQYPGRFIFGLDNVWQNHWGDFYLDQVKYWRKAMSDLPDEVAHAVAHGNAERLWRIPPRTD